MQPGWLNCQAYNIKNVEATPGIAGMLFCLLHYEGEQAVSEDGMYVWLAF